MRTRTRTKLVRNLDAREVEACERLTLPRGMMRPQFRRFRHDVDDSRVFMIEDEAGELLAWALLFDAPPMTVYMFVRHDMRRRGFGTRLVRRTRKHAGGPVRVIAWNPASTAFYDTMEGVRVERW